MIEAEAKAAQEKAAAEQKRQEEIRALQEAEAKIKRENMQKAAGIFIAGMKCAGNKNYNDAIK